MCNNEYDSYIRNVLGDIDIMEKNSDSPYIAPGYLAGESNDIYDESYVKPYIFARDMKKLNGNKLLKDFYYGNEVHNYKNSNDGICYGDKYNSYNGYNGRANNSDKCSDYSDKYNECNSNVYSNSYDRQKSSDKYNSYDNKKGYDERNVADRLYKSQMTYANGYGNMNYAQYLSDSQLFGALDLRRYRFEKMYPEIYKILRPMVKKACYNMRADSLSEDAVEQMADDIYANVEADINVVNIEMGDINIGNKVENSFDGDIEIGNKIKNSIDGDIEISNSADDKVNSAKINSSGYRNMHCHHGCSNPILKDLIKIMIITEILKSC